jgi:hypothetical protein
MVDVLASFSVGNLLNEECSRYLDVSPNPNHGLNSAPLPLASLASRSNGARTVHFSDAMLFGG